MAHCGTDASAVVRTSWAGKDAAAHPSAGAMAMAAASAHDQRPMSACSVSNRWSSSQSTGSGRVFSARVRTPAPSLGAFDALVDDASADLDAAAHAKTSHDSAHVGDWFPAPQEKPPESLRAHRREERGSDDRRRGEVGAGRGDVEEVAC